MHRGTENNLLLFESAVASHYTSVRKSGHRVVQLAKCLSRLLDELYALELVMMRIQCGDQLTSLVEPIFQSNLGCLRCARNCLFFLESSFVLEIVADRSSQQNK